MNEQCRDCAHSSYCRGRSADYCRNHITRQEAAEIYEHKNRERWEAYAKERRVKPLEMCNMREND